MARVYCDAEDCANHDGRDGCALDWVDLSRYLVSDDEPRRVPACNDYERDEEAY